MLPSQLKQNPDVVIDEVEKKDILIAAREFEKLRHGIWCIISIVFVLIGLLARSGMLYLLTSAEAGEKEFDNMLLSANVQSFQPQSGFVNGGCYRDERNDLGNIAIKPNFWSGLDGCQSICKHKFNSTFYGIEGGNRCRCGKTAPMPNRKVESNQCNYAGCFSRTDFRLLGSICEAASSSTGLMGGKDRVTMYNIDYLPYYNGACYDNSDGEGKLDLIVQDDEWKAHFIANLIQTYGQEFSEKTNINESDIDRAVFTNTSIMNHDQCAEKCLLGLNR